MPTIISTSTIPQNSQLAFTVANGTTPQELFTNNRASFLLDALLVTNADAITHHVNFLFDVNGTKFLIGSLTIPAGQGKAGTPALDLLAAALPPNFGTMLGDGFTNVFVALEEAALADNTVVVWQQARLV